MGDRLPPHLGLVPLLRLLDIAGGHGLVLAADVTQGGRQVWLACINLDMHPLPGQLLLQLPQLLGGQRGSAQPPLSPGTPPSPPSGVTSSWTLRRKAISSCRVPTRRSRSRRAKAAASTSCHRGGTGGTVPRAGHPGLLPPELPGPACSCPSLPHPCPICPCPSLPIPFPSLLHPFPIPSPSLLRPCPI